MPSRLLSASLALWASVAVTQPTPPGDARLSRMVRRQQLVASLQRDDVEAAAEAVDALLAGGTDPFELALTIQSSLSPRTGRRLHDALGRHGSPGVTEILLSLAAARGDWDAVDSLRAGLAPSARTLSFVGEKAREDRRPEIAAWAYEALRRAGGPWGGEAALPLAEALVELDRVGEAESVLERVLRPGGVSPERAPALVLRARLCLRVGRDEEALEVLRSVPRGRPERAQADVLEALVRFTETGGDSLAAHLERMAARCPDLPEANDAFDFARLGRRLPPEPAGGRLLAGMREELRRRWASAAEQYAAARLASPAELAVPIGIREARCWERAGEWERALKAWAQLSSNHDGGPVVLLGLGDCLRALGKADSALACYEAVLQRFPSSPHASRARARILE